MKIGLIGYGELGKQVAHFISVADAQAEFVYFDDVAFAAGTKNSFAFADYTKEEHKDLYFVIALGYKHLLIKNQVLTTLASEKRRQFTFVHPTAIIDPTAFIGEGTIVYPGVVIDKNVMIGKAVLINLSVTISHDSLVNDCCFLAPAAVLCGFTKIGERSFVGANATLIDNVSVAADVVVGAGAVVTRNIGEPGVYSGCPAAKKK